MSQQEISCGIEYSVPPDLSLSLSESTCFNYGFLVTPIVHPRFRRHYIGGAGCIGGFTRSEMVIATQEWSTRIVAKLSPYINVDTDNNLVNLRNEDCFNEEMAHCRGLGVPAILLSLHGENSTNLARLILNHYEVCQISTLLWVQVPMQCPRTARNNTEEDNEDSYNVTWKWWSKFHELLDWEKRVGVALELSADLPSEEVIDRWLGEPVKAIVIPTSVFRTNKSGYPVLSKPHRRLVIEMVSRDAQVVVTGARRLNMEHYNQFLQHLWLTRPKTDDDAMAGYARGWEDYLQTPLQPLADNLDSQTYHVFEKDPIKYNQYQKAIAKALVDIKERQGTCQERGEGDKDNRNQVTVMVLGAGRGPLVRATLNAAGITDTKVKVIAVEKNPCAVVVLTAQARDMWRGHDVTVVSGDMRHLDLNPKADVIVSELLGSWGDNELSPECLDGAAGLLKPDGISIPCAYTSYAAPISSARLWGAAKVASVSATTNRDKNLETLWVVYMRNKHDIAETKPIFTFTHPSQGVPDNAGNEVRDYRGLPLTDNRRCQRVTWVSSQDSVMHGFGGYFDCSLYGGEMISIEPNTHSASMISWFPVFIPIKTPIRVQKGDTITATFWRCVNARKVWYEWVVAAGGRTTCIHNTAGRSTEMLL